MYRDRLSNPAKISLAIGAVILVVVFYRLSKNLNHDWLQRQETLSQDPTLSVIPSTIENGGTVTLEWRNIPDPTQRVFKKDQSDWIGLFCPSSSTSDSYIDRWPVSELSAIYPSSSGRVNLRLYSVRTDCQFRYFINDKKLVAATDKVTFVDGAKAPLHAHLALTGDASEMRVQWTTGVQYTPTVEYGPCDGGKLDRLSTGTSRTYQASDMCGPPANLSAHFIHPGYMHDVILTGLQPNTKYCYRYGSPGFSYSKEKTFVSSLPPGTPQPFKFVTYGDMGTSRPPGGQATAELVHREVEENGVALILHVGDLSYSMGVAYEWDKWMSLIEPYASRVPYMINVGNHEQEHKFGGEKDPSHAPGIGFHPIWGNYGDDSGGECGMPVYNRFHMPDNKNGNQPWWYSFEYGLVHFTVFSTEHNFTRGSPQHAWLLGDLTSVDRSRTPWLVLATHRPMYTSQRIPPDYKVSTHLRQVLEPLFHETKVNLLIAGHIHSYERTCAVYQERCVGSGGVTHVVVGTGGTDVEDSGTWKFDWSKHFEAVNGYGRVTVANSSSLLWEFVRNQDNHVTDSVWIIQ
jgi:hypothetical protein